ncbi:glutaminyl-peptide cyclotransferase [Erythrobacter sp. MTPC3]|uniref:glutaminyl-peptide cyclotransferase n=1 Tax=Erythrobacter sp. MTPC3 TaxID=3056564 RepID=UPI0036F37920
MTRKSLPLLLAAPLLLGAAPQAAPPPADVAAAEAQPQTQSESAYTGPVVYRAEIVAQYPHDSGAFTQGLLWHDGALYESTGRVGQSRVRKVDLETGKVLMEQDIPPDQFGEGLALWHSDLISLTWRDNAVHRWRLDTLAPIASIADFPFEGWGLTTTDDGLVFSDGSDTLRFIDPDTYEVERSVKVTLNGDPLTQLNELEMIDGQIFANIWRAPYIAIIDPQSGVVTGLIDLRGITSQVPATGIGAVLNGIAWDADRRRLFVTGKLWPTLFEIRLVETTARVG